MPRATDVASLLRSGVLVVKPGEPTPLPKERRCLAVTIWNRTGVDLGIGGADLSTDRMLPDGGSYRVAVSDPSAVHLLHRGPDAVEVAYTIEE